MYLDPAIGWFLLGFIAGVSSICLLAVMGNARGWGKKQ